MGIPMGVTLLILVGLFLLGSALVLSAVLALRTEITSGVGRRGPPAESAEAKHWADDLSTDELYEKLLERRVVDDRFKIGLMKERPESHKSNPCHDNQDAEDRSNHAALNDDEHSPLAPHDAGRSGTASHAEAQVSRESIDAKAPPSFIGETGLEIVRERRCRFGWRLIQNMPVECLGEEGVW